MIPPHSLALLTFLHALVVTAYPRTDDWGGSYSERYTGIGFPIQGERYDIIRACNGWTSNGAHVNGFYENVHSTPYHYPSSHPPWELILCVI